MTKLKVLCVDGEGGYGGSSRSLAKALTFIDKEAVDVEVWCRRVGPIQKAYTTLGINCEVHPDIPRAGSVARISRNLASQLRARYSFANARSFKRAFMRRAKNVDLVHYNLESQWLLASWARPNLSAAQTMHVRTNPIPNWFAEQQSRIAAASIDSFVFISQNERAHFESLNGGPVDGAVILNIADKPKPTIPHENIPIDERLRICVLSNYDWARGIDRFVDVAAELARRGRRDFLFVVAGDMHLQGPMPPALKRIANAGGSLPDFVQHEELSDMFCFLGHVENPESVLAACDVLAKPTRLNDPWARDIIEALAAGKPVLSQGYDKTFVETDVTGVLFPSFDESDWADTLINLSADRARIDRMGAEGARRVSSLCDGPSRANDLLTLWREAVAHRQLRNHA